jgi:hypothetical protein
MYEIVAVTVPERLLYCRLVRRVFHVVQLMRTVRPCIRRIARRARPLRCLIGDTAVTAAALIVAVAIAAASSRVIQLRVRAVIRSIGRCVVSLRSRFRWTIGLSVVRTRAAVLVTWMRQWTLWTRRNVHRC